MHDDMPAQRMVRVASTEPPYEVPLVYQRGVWAVIEYAGLGGVVHVPSGCMFRADQITNEAWLAPVDDAINAVRALTPWSDFGEDLPFAEFRGADFPDAAMAAFRQAARIHR